jgi:hypothetical protein
VLLSVKQTSPVGEAQRRAAGLRGKHRRFPAVGADAHQPHVCVRDVEVAGVVVEPKAQRPAAGALRGDRRELRLRVAAVLRVARAVRERRPPGAALAAVLEDAAVRDADVGPGAAAVERDALGADQPVGQLQASMALAATADDGSRRQQQGEKDREERQLRSRPPHGRCHVEVVG